MIIDDFVIGVNAPTYLIAEMSANHNGSLDNAKKTIISAKNAGANAVKLQTYTADTLTIKSNRPEFFLKGGLWDGYHLYDLYSEAHTPFEWHAELFQFGRENGITIFSTPFDHTAVDLLEELNAPAFKIASFEIVDLPLIERVASCRKPIFISTGTASLEEISTAVNVAKRAGAQEILLFHCISAYPADLKDSILERIKLLQDRFDVLVGLSDHSIGSDAGFLSVALGAVAIEKHFIADRSIGGVDADFSATPHEFFQLRERVDLAKEMLGASGSPRPASEKQGRNF